MKKELAIIMENRPMTFLDEIWPTENKYLKQDDLKNEIQSSSSSSSIPKSVLMDDVDDGDEKCGWTDIRKWRIQTLLAISPWGIPLVSFPKAYEKMYNRKFRVQEFGYDILIHMVTDRPDIFSIQEPDELTEIIFPEYPQDKVLHDARFGQNFDYDKSANSADISFDSVPNLNRNEINWDELISIAWLNKDDDFPANVVLPGEEFCDLLLPLTEAKLPDTNGIYKGIIIGLANPESIYINIQSPDLSRVMNLSIDVKNFFKNSTDPLDMYRVPKEFIYPGFPCLVFINEDGSWERGKIVGKSSRGDRVLVDAVDYGGIHTVARNQLYLMPKEFNDFPPQAILVSMFGLKPSFGEIKWKNGVSSRLRNFSYPHYYLDFLLMKPDSKKQQLKYQQPPLLSSNNNGGDDKKDDEIIDESERIKSELNRANNNKLSSKIRKKKIPQYEAIICDRNDEDGFDIYLNDIIIRETYAVLNDEEANKYKKLRKELEEAFKNVSRPKNPMVGKFFN